MKKNNYKLIIIAVLFFLLGYLVQGNLLNKKRISSDVDSNDFVLFWDVWNTLEEKYPFKEPSSADKRYQAIKGLVSAYDDEYSDFFPPEESKLFRETVTGQFAGAGMEIGIRDGYLVVIAPLKNSPAEKAGFLAGDVITHIDEVDVFNQSLSTIVKKIRGEVGSKVTIKIVRFGNSDPLDIVLIRDIVKIPILETETINDVFIISLYNFNTGSENDFKKALIEFKQSDLEYLLIDVRNNPGGYLLSSIDIASYFLNQGEVIVKEDFGDSGKDKRIHRSKGYNLLDDVEYKLGVLINKGSASASEIFAGALQDHNKAIIIGETSYGKGSVQELIEFDQGTSLKITTAKWLTPNDLHISKKGIIPDFPISSTNDFDSFKIESLNILKNN